MTNRKMDKWQIGLLFCNILLSITGFNHCFLSGLLVIFYHMDDLYYLEGWYYYFPLMTGLIGIMVIIFAFVGIVSTIFKNKIGLIVFSVMMGLTIIPQLLNIYLAGKVTSSISTGMTLQSSLMENHLLDAMNANDEPAVKAFFRIQESFGCCGVDTDRGYEFWKKSHSSVGRVDDTPDTNFPDRENTALLLQEYTLPKSCCINCGSNVCKCDTDDFFPTTTSKLISNTMYKVGCLPIIEMVYKRELLAGLDLGYMLFALVCAALEFSGVFVSVFYVKVLAKRKKSLDLSS